MRQLNLTDNIFQMRQLNLTDNMFLLTVSDSYYKRLSNSPSHL